MLAVAVVTIGLSAFFYRMAFRHLARSQLRILFALRAAAILVIILLLFRPLLSFQKDVAHRKAVIFLVDSSASMGTKDDASGNSRFDLARERLPGWWGKLEKNFDLFLFDFSDQATALAKPGDLMQRQATGQATSLSGALTAGAQQVPRKEVEAVILVTDGIHNATGDPVQTAQTLGLCVHTIGVGNSLRDSPSFKDVRIAGFELPGQLPVNNQALIKASVESVGLNGRVVKVVLEEDGKQVAESELELTTREGGQPVTFQFLPTVKGRHTYTVRVPVLGDEKITENNQRSAFSQIVDSRIRVLYLEGALRGEFGALVQRFLSNDPNIEFCALVQTRPGVFVQRSNIAGTKLESIPKDQATLDKFDVFILGDLDSSFLREHMALLVKRVREGGGLVMLGGYHSLGPGSYQGTPLDGVLPLVLGDKDIGQVNDAFLPCLTPEGRKHPIFANIEKFFPSLTGEAQDSGLPPLDGCTKVLRAKAGASVLAVFKGEAGSAADAMPVMAVQPAGKGRTAIFTGDTTRNWQQGPRVLNQESPFLRFWGQTVRWLANRTESVKTEAGILPETDKPYYEPDSPIKVSATIRDKEGEGVREAQVRALIKGPDNLDASVPLYRDDGPAGHFSGTYLPKQSGTFEITIRAKIGETTMNSEKLAVEVGRANLEFDRLDLNENLLSRLASAVAGGRYEHISNADRLIEQVQQKEMKRRVFMEQPLYWPPLFWLVLVGALAGEWVLRKKYQLR